MVVLAVMVLAVIYLGHIENFFNVIIGVSAFYQHHLIPVDSSPLRNKIEKNCLKAKLSPWS